MADKPTVIPRFAVNDQIDPVTGSNNVQEPPEEKILAGWNYGEFPPRGWMNWLHRLTYKWLEYFRDNFAKVTDGAGVGLCDIDNHMITVYAIDKTTPANYLIAFGYKATGNAPSLTVLANNVLTLGTGTAAGDQPISGGTAGNIIAHCRSVKV